MKRTFRFVAVAAACAIAPLQAFAQDKVIRVGVLMPISGPASISA